jgi:hypothetical protein
VASSDIGHPVEDALLARQFGKHHHPDEEKIDVEPFPHRMRCLPDRQQSGGDEQERATTTPICLGDSAWARQHGNNAADCDQRDKRDVGQSVFCAASGTIFARGRRGGGQLEVPMLMESGTGPAGFRMEALSFE